jgi:HEAT repeat protein
MTSLIAIATYLIIKKSDSSSWGFKDLVRDPAYWTKLQEERQDADQAAVAAQAWDDATIAKQVRHFVLNAPTAREMWSDFKALQSLGPRVHQPLLDLLRDKQLYALLVKPTGEDIVPETPFNRACDLLGNTPPKEAVDALAPFLIDASDGIRKDAARTIAKTGSTEITPYIRRALNDDVEYVRSHTLIGLESALTANRLNDNVSHDLFPDIKRLLEEGKNADDATAVLFCLNREAATSFYLSPEVFHAESRIIHNALRVLANTRTSVPRGDLLALISSLDVKDIRYPKTYALSEALRLLGQRQNAEDRDKLTSYLDHPENEVARGAGAGLLASHGLEDFQQKIWDKEEKSGIQSLSTDQQYVSAVLVCDGEINNGGFSQYFVNSSGNDWKHALAGLEAMASTERLRLLKEALAVFGPNGPSEDREKRQHQLSKIYGKNDTIFENLESQYYKSNEHLDPLIARFVIAHAESFR